MILCDIRSLTDVEVGKERGGGGFYQAEGNTMKIIKATGDGGDFSSGGVTK